MADDPKPDPKPEPAPDLGKLVEAAVAKHGDQTSALKAIVSDLIATREDLTKARANQPKDGALVLTGDDAKDYGAYRNIGKPSDLRKTVEEHAALASENAALKRDSELRGVAEKAGVKHAVLKTLAGALAFGEAEIEVTKDGKKSKVNVVTVKEGEAAPVPFDEYAAKNWGDFLPALKPTAQATTTTSPARQPATPSRTDNTRPTTGQPQTGTATVTDRHLATVRGAF